MFARAPVGVYAAAMRKYRGSHSTARPRRIQHCYEATLQAMSLLATAAALLPPDHPAHQELDQARLAVRVALDVLRP